MITTTKQVGDFIKPTVRQNYPKSFFHRYFKIIFVVFLVLILAIAGYVYTYRQSYISSDTISQSEIKNLTEKVGMLAFLPADETPTIAKISNKELLKDQPFFADAKTGDVVLIFSNAKKAILYDPVANKIVNMSTVNVGNEKILAPTPEKTTPQNSIQTQSSNNEF